MEFVSFCLTLDHLVKCLILLKARRLGLCIMVECSVETEATHVLFFLRLVNLRKIWFTN